MCLAVTALKVSSALANGSNVSLGSGIIPAGYRPTSNICAWVGGNAASLGAGCYLYITTAGNVSLYNRSGASLGTGTNLYGNAAWIV